MFSCFGNKNKQIKKDENSDNLEEELKKSEELLQK
jgi:hypothetical protein